MLPLVTTNALTSVNINGFKRSNSTEEKFFGISLIVNSFFKTMFQVSARRQVKNYMH